MAGTLTIKIGKPGPKAAIRKGCYPWTVYEGRVGLGWGQADRAEEAEEQAWDFLASNIVAEEIDTVQVIRS